MVARTGRENPFLFANIEYAIFPAQAVKLAFDLNTLRIHGSRYSPQAEQFRFGATASTSSALPPLKLVLIVGESARPDRWSLFGYNRDTTPCLRDLQHSSAGRMVVFPNVTAGANLTAVALPMIVGRATPQDMAPAERERSLLGLFREAGLRTFWISSQDRFPYSLDADVAYYGNPSWATVGRYDEDLLPMLEQTLVSEHRALLVVHTIGNHWAYHQRYRPSERFFSSTGGSAADSYDDSVRAVDRFLCRVFELAERDADPVLVWYIADHGENLPGDPGPTRRSEHGSATPSRWEATIPMIAWANQRFATENDSIRLLAGRQNLPLDQSVIFDTFAGLAAINFPSYRPEKDLTNPVFRASTERWILGGSHKVLHRTSDILEGS